ncbi:MAG: transcriptional regulator [Acidimicrobiales bacterium]
MSQLTWRTTEEALERVRAAAQRHGRSMNDYVTWVLDVATDPDRAGTASDRLRERLAAAGVLVPPGPPRERPAADRVERARAAAGTGAPLSQLVSEGR